MRIAVIGPGAVGGYFGGRLAQHGEDVWFVAHGRTLQALGERGLRVDSINGDFVLPRVQVAERGEDIGPVDVVLVAVKSWQIPELASTLKPLLGPHTVVVPLENGVEAPEELARIAGADKVLLGLCGLVSAIVEPGHIRHFALDPFIAFGEHDNSHTPRVENLRATLDKPGIKVNVPGNIQARQWMKFLFITSLGGVGSVARAPVGIVRSTPATREMLHRSMVEIARLAESKGVQLAATAVDDTMAQIDGMAPGNTTSMQRDILEGRPSELDSQCGAVVRLGRKQGLDLPVNAAIYAALLPSELRARGELAFERL